LGGFFELKEKRNGDGTASGKANGGEETFTDSRTIEAKAKQSHQKQNATSLSGII
jgi:hypothetical protein